MKSTTRLAALLLAALGAALGSFAADNTQPPPPTQAQHGPAGRAHPIDPEKRLARLTGHLGLTAEQQSKLRPIFAAEAEEMRKFDATPLTGEQRREKMRELRKANREKIAAILTPEQREKFARERRRGGPGRHGPEAGGPPPPPAEAE